ncbi:putative B3 domain-containing protein At5g66980 [Carya illinoinensis]|uniref:TF-B3 domain-containing protein n=1 Tax=Carya illinoinensis TaxID=32201 RepID=A0A8T1RHM7_CARIL|nr:putative B3 domain-containing protein At5g66980 [Carya illinoinensis]XP_042974846.1 putative B3 domain-containing protein At5g66980 [Carya illinoinensis]KAG6666376.1 hypothetical protein CIPAW_01G027400 [Carya illinoinensis]
MISLGFHECTRKDRGRAGTTMPLFRGRRQPYFPEDGPEFFKVFLPFTCSHEISIPPTFIKHFTGNIPKKAILIDHTGNSWPVELDQIGSRLCFKCGWQQFASDHSLEFGDFLIFKYNRSNVFKVKIFNKTGCMKYEAEAMGKALPCLTPEEDSTAGQTCGRLTRGGKRKLLQIGLKTNEEAGVSSKANQHKSRRIAGANLEQNKSPKVARVVAPKNPYFVTSITKFMRYTLCVRRSVVNAYNIKLKQEVVIRGPNEEKCPVKIVKRSNGRIMIANGWSYFVEKNAVQPKDQCVFEFILGRGNTCREMRVQILRGNARFKKLPKDWLYREKA